MVPCKQKTEVPKKFTETQEKKYRNNFSCMKRPVLMRAPRSEEMSKNALVVRGVSSILIIFIALDSDF